MLSRELMGALCLGVVWVTALLVAAAALQDLADLRRIGSRAKGAIVGVAKGDLARWKVEQTARAIDAKRDEAIAFHERRFVSEVLGGRLEAGDTAYEVQPSQNAQVWVERSSRVNATRCPDVATFDEVYAQARKAKGAAREAAVTIGDGDRVFVLGRVEDAKIDPEIVSTLDPVAFCNRNVALILGFIPAELAVCGVATLVALHKPHFGRVSILGAVLCLAFFLGVTPLAVALREHVRRPHEAFLRTKWFRSALSHAQAHSQGKA